MAEYLIQDTTLDAIADAINAKTGGSSAMTPLDMPTEIESIQTGGGSNIYTVDYTPSVNSQSVSIPLPFSYVPVFVYIYADADNLPSAPPVDVVKNIMISNFSANDSITTWPIDTTGGTGRRTNTIKAGGGADYWSSTPTGTVTNNALTVDVSNKSLYFYAGVTYHVVAVEV